MSVDDAMLAAALVEGEGAAVLDTLRALAERAGPVVAAHAAPSAALTDAGAYCLDWLIEEVATSINTTAAGGNASLMAVT